MYLKEPLLTFYSICIFELSVVLYLKSIFPLEIDLNDVDYFQNLGSMMEYILAKEHKDRLHILSDIRNEAKKRELRTADEEEDFLDEGGCLSVSVSLSVCVRLSVCPSIHNEAKKRELKTANEGEDFVYEGGCPSVCPSVFQCVCLSDT